MKIKRMYQLLRGSRAEEAGAAPQPPPQQIAALQEPGSLSFRCNICGQHAVARVADLGRESRSCSVCGSTVRWRSIVRALSKELFAASLALADFPSRPDIAGIGMSDWEGYAALLAQKLAYQNTYLHQEPALDITQIDPAHIGAYDFVISSDVFEHVPPPIAVAFENTRRLLKPGGVLILSVPYRKDGLTVEHFPNLYDYRLEEADGAYRLRNVTREGAVEIFESPVFHEGPGATLEMRMFAEASLIQELRRAGFADITVYGDPDFVHGIYWHEDYNLPLAARAGAER